MPVIAHRGVPLVPTSQLAGRGDQAAAPRLRAAGLRALARARGSQLQAHPEGASWSEPWLLAGRRPLAGPGSEHALSRESWIADMARPVSPPGALQVCQVSGLIINDEESRLRDHYGGRNYNSWKKLHEVRAGPRGAGGDLSGSVESPGVARGKQRRCCSSRERAGRGSWRSSCWAVSSLAPWTEGAAASEGQRRVWPGRGFPMYTQPWPILA